MSGSDHKEAAQSLLDFSKAAYLEQPDRFAHTCVLLTKHNFNLQLQGFLRNTHCSTGFTAYSVNAKTGVVSTAKSERIGAVQKLSTLTQEYLLTHITEDKSLYLKKKRLNKDVLVALQNNKGGKKSSTIEVDSLLSGVMLLGLHKEIQLSGLKRCMANNLFTHYQRLDRGIIRQQAEDMVKAHGMDKDLEQVSYQDLEEKLKVTLFVYNEWGFLVHVSERWRKRKCVFFNSKGKWYVIKPEKLTAFGTVFNKKKAGRSKPTL